ncbi:MAG TPA: MBL fold metallo-hydrolase [Candidatus Paceibacterota bacterium]
MIIKKFLHSCLLLEKDGKKLLIDPGSFSFVEGKIKPEDIGPVDIILITHQHTDHYFPEALKKILSLKEPKIITSDEIGALLTGEGIKYHAIFDGDEIDIDGFNIKAINAAHGLTPTLPPHNFAYLIDGKLLHPGDSMSVSNDIKCDVLALPISAPWARMIDLLEFGAKFNASKIIPIHEKILADYWIPRAYDISRSYLEKKGKEFYPLEIGESLEI